MQSQNATSFSLDAWVLAEVFSYSMPETLAYVWILRAILLFKVEQLAFLPLVFLKWCNWLPFCFMNLIFFLLLIYLTDYLFPDMLLKRRRMLRVALMYLFWLTFLVKPMEEQNLTLNSGNKCYLSCTHPWLVDNLL